jgi:hypothetical protein
MPVVLIEAERVEMLRIRTQPVTRTTLGVIGLTRGPGGPGVVSSVAGWTADGLTRIDMLG